MTVELAKAMAERSSMNKDLMLALANKVAENEKVQRRFRTTVLIKLAKIETTLTMIHGAQLVEAQQWQPGYEEKLKEQAKSAEDYIDQHSKELGLKMVNYIYGEPEQPSEPPGRKRKWSDWEI